MKTKSPSSIFHDDYYSFLLHHNVHLAVLISNYLQVPSLNLNLYIFQTLYFGA